MHDYRERERRFLDAWKRGVQLAGEGCFKLKAPTVEAATHKRQLEPDWNYVEETLTARSRGEAAFLAAMCSFYNAESQSFFSTTPGGDHPEPSNPAGDAIPVGVPRLRQRLRGDAS